MPNDTNRVEILYKLCQKLKDNNPQKALLYVVEADEISNKINYAHGKHINHYFFGEIYRKQLNPAKAEKHYLAWLDGHLKIKDNIPNKIALSTAYNTLSDFYFEQNNPKKAKIFLEKSLSHAKNFPQRHDFIPDFLTNKINQEKINKDKNFDKLLFFNEKFYEFIQNYPPTFPQEMKKKYTQQQKMAGYLSLSPYLKEFSEKNNKKMYEKVLKLSTPTPKNIEISYRNAHYDWLKTNPKVAFEYMAKVYKNDQNLAETQVSRYETFSFASPKNAMPNINNAYKTHEMYVDEFVKIFAKDKKKWKQNIGIRNAFAVYKSWIYYLEKVIEPQAPRERRRNKTTRFPTNEEKQIIIQKIKYYYLKSLPLVNMYGSEEDIFFWKRKLTLFYQKNNFHEEAYAMFRKYFQPKQKDNFTQIYTFFGVSKSPLHRFEMLNIAYNIAEKTNNDHEKKTALRILYEEWLTQDFANEIDKTKLKKQVKKLKLNPKFKEFLREKMG